MAKQDSLVSSYFDSDTEEHSSPLKIRPTKYVLANPRESRGSLSFARLSDTSNTTNNSLVDKENEIRKQTMIMKLRETNARLSLHEPDMSSISESGYKKGKQSINDFKLDTHNSVDFESDLSIEAAKKMTIRFSRISIPSELFSSPESTIIDQSQNMTDDRNELEHISIESSTADIRKSDLENTLSDSKIIKNVDKLEDEIFKIQNSKSSPLVFLSSKNLSDVNTSLNKSSGRNTSTLEDESCEFESLLNCENQCENSSQLSKQSLRNNSSVKLNKTENSFQSKSMDLAIDSKDWISKNLRSSKKPNHNDSKISNQSLKSSSSKKSATNTNLDHIETINESSSTLGTFENQNEDYSLDMFTYTINQDNPSHTSFKRNSSRKNKNMIDFSQACSNETVHFKRFSLNRTHTNTSSQNEEDNVNANNDQNTMVANETMPTNDQEIDNEIENGEEISEEEDYISEDNRTKSDNDSDSENDFNYKQDDSSTSEDEISSIERNSAIGTHNSINSEKHSQFSFSKPSTSHNRANTSELFGNVTFVFPGDTPQSTIIKRQSDGIIEQFTPIRKTNSTSVQSNTSKSIGKNIFETAVKSFQIQEPSINGRAQMDLNMLETDRASVRSNSTEENNLSSLSQLSEKFRKPNAQSTFLVSRTPQKKSHSNDIHKFLQQINKNNIRRNYSPKRHFSQKNNELNPCQPMLVHIEPAVTKVIKSDRAKTQIKKNEIRIDGVPYKKPRLKKLPYYTTRIEKCIIEKMDLVDSKDTHAKLHGFLSYISQCVNCIMKKKDYQAKLIDALMYKLAKYKIINSRNQFFSFVIKHFPDKAVWKIVPTLKPTCDNMPEFDPDTLDDPIIQEQVEES